MKLEKIKDPKLKLPITQIRDGIAGPDSNSVTFSGRTIDANGQVRWLIYSCKTNGQEVKQLSPSLNSPSDFYDMGIAKKSTRYLSEELVRQEIAFSQLQAQ